MFNYETQNYLREQSIAEIIKNAFGVYKDYFREIFFSYALLVLPVSIFSFAVLYYLSEFALLGVVIYFSVNFLAGTVASMAITAIVSDVCLGNTPGIVKAYKRLSIKSIGKLVGTTLMFYLA